MIRIKTTALTGLLISLAIVVHAVAAVPQPANDNEAQLKALQDERVEVLAQLVKHTMAQYQMGTAQLSEIIAAQRELLAARLDSTHDPEKRVALLVDQLESAAQLLKMTEARLAVGQTTQADVYRAKSSYLDVKIKLFQERSRNKQTPMHLTGKQQ